MTMKKTLKIMAALLVAFAFALPALALDDPANGFGVGSTNSGGTASYVIVSARSANGGAPAVSLINATSDLTTSKVQFYKVTEETVAQYATNSTTTLSVNNTNGFASGNTIIIRHMGADSYEKRTLTTMTGATNLVVTAAPLGAVVPGDRIYKVVSAGVAAVPVGNATLSVTGQYLFVGQRGKPLLADLTGTSSCQLNALGGVYLP